MPAEVQEKLVKVRIGKSIPSLRNTKGGRAEPGDYVEVTQAKVDSFRQRRMLYEQVKADQAEGDAQQRRTEAKKEDANGDTLRRIIKNQDSQIEVLNEQKGRLEKQVSDLQVALRDALASAESLKADVARLTPKS